MGCDFGAGGYHPSSVHAKPNKISKGSLVTLDAYMVHEGYCNDRPGVQPAEHACYKLPQLTERMSSIAISGSHSSCT
jgi:hypothetical protein